ncbi:MAG TPA: methyltransferase domain-containing protein [Actinomycetota bacterium]|nr:methyltransferase domain-containing protein [Actinomycetota bacterium]
MFGLTRANVRHVLGLFRLGPRPAVTVYESLGTDFFLAPAPGWLNLGWWEGEGSEDEAPRAPQRLVEILAASLPRGGAILDVANGLGAQDPVIARVAQPRLLAAVNLAEFQLRAGRERLASAEALPAVADAVRLPFHDSSFDGLICVEAAFHFSSRAAFFAEAVRVLRPGGSFVMSDVTVERRPRTIRDAVAGLVQLRIWGMRTRQLASAGRIAGLAEAAGFEDVHIELCAARTIDPALRLARTRVASPGGLPRAHVWGARVGLRQAERLRARGFIQYALLTARAPSVASSAALRA